MIRYALRISIAASLIIALLVGSVHAGGGAGESASDAQSGKAPNLAAGNTTTEARAAEPGPVKADEAPATTDGATGDAAEVPEEAPEESADDGWVTEIVKAGASQAIIEKHSGKLNSWEDDVTAAEKTVANPETAESALAALPGRLDTIARKLEEFKVSLKPKLEEANAQLKKLGPPPKKGEPVETDDVVANRRKISSEVAAYTNLLKLADVLSVRLRQTIEGANNQRRANFNSRLLRPAPNFFSAKFWQSAFAGVEHRREKLSQSITGIATGISKHSNWWLLAIVVLPLALFFAVRWFISRARREFGGDDQSYGAVPTLSARAARAFSGSLLSLLPYVVAGLALYAVLDRVGVLTSRSHATVNSTLVLLLCATFLISLVRRSLIPKQDNWALLRRSLRPVRRRIANLLSAITVVGAVNEIATVYDGILDSTYEFIVFRSLVMVLIIATLIFALLLALRRHNQDGDSDSSVGDRWRWFIVFGVLLIAIVLGSAALGYVAFANFVVIRVPVAAAVAAAFVLFRYAADFGVQKGLQLTSNGTDMKSDPVAVASAVVLDILLVTSVVPVILLLVGFDWITVRSWIYAAFFGFDVGGFTFSLQSLLIAVGLFAGGLIVTRFVQRWFDQRSGTIALGGAGVRDSVKTILGYTGFALSLVLAITFLGLDLTNLAIVAGALSVGIGFGLQSIFNNFVSGLILLVERPIKVGDYIRVGSDEGTVKRINVRATEIETLDRQSVIMPNARLITDPVVNWMHNDLMARLVISVGVSYSSDVELVRETLLAVANESHEILSMPAPFVYFSGYGNSSLDFELRAYIPNATRRVPLTSELRFAIWHALKKAGIEIPFPQRDLHVKSLGDLKLPVEPPLD